MEDEKRVSSSVPSRERIRGQLGHFIALFTTLGYKQLGKKPQSKSEWSKGNYKIFGFLAGKIHGFLL